jgi:hypothetical protein
MASTGVPPTGRSRAFANRFSGFHRAKRLIGGSSLTGVSVATGVRRSRTRIDPCFRAARTHAPVRRCSSLIEISFMCHIVTHRSFHRLGMAHRSRHVLSQLLGCFTAKSSFPGPLLRGHRVTKSPIGSIETKILQQPAASPTRPMELPISHILTNLDILEHPNPSRYAGQRIFVVRREDYVYLVPFVEDEHTVFLKTIIPSRKATKQYLGEESDDEDGR